MTEARVCIGLVVGAHGIRGAVRIKSFTTDPFDIQSYGPVSDETQNRTFKLSILSESKGTLIARFSGVTDRNSAEALKGTRLFVARSALPDLDEDEFFYEDLKGVAAELSDGTPFGRVKGVFEAGAGDILEIIQPDGTSFLLSFTKRSVPVVDIANHRIVVDPPFESDED